MKTSLTALLVVALMGAGIWLCQQLEVHLIVNESGKLVLWRYTADSHKQLIFLYTSETPDSLVPLIGQHFAGLPRKYVIEGMTRTAPWHKGGWDFLEGEYRFGVLFDRSYGNYPELDYDKIPATATRVAYWVLFIPWWWLTLPFGLVLIVAAVQDERRRWRDRRPQRDLCLNCGYSRQGISSTSLCPECGCPPKAKRGRTSTVKLTV